MRARRTSRALIPLAATLVLVALSLCALSDDTAKLTITCDRDKYRAGDPVAVEARLKAPEAALANVTLEVDYPDGSVLLLLTNVTGGNGVALFRFRLPADAPDGSYNLSATCDHNSTRLGAQSRFIIGKGGGGGGREELAMPLVPVVATAAIGLMGLGLAVGATEPGKYGFFALFAALFTRLNRDEALDHRVRHQILGYLTENPGQHYNGLKKALNITNGGMVYHLLVLEREGFIRSQRDGILKRFYPANVKAPEKRQRTPEELVSEILEAVGKRPGITQRELVERLVVNDEVVGYHLRKLVREARIISWKKGKTRVYFPLKK
ncbi:MAG: helix-turn-helix domain-containing protein [Euryarchaeota archaeon]|nr:helix-turn-helix domain-containing protein [Euryarchaeota archaeon]